MFVREDFLVEMTSRISVLAGKGRENEKGRKDMKREFPAKGTIQGRNYTRNYTGNNVLSEDPCNKDLAGHRVWKQGLNTAVVAQKISSR